MATYTGTADSNGDFNIPFGTEYTSGEKVTITAEKNSETKSIELYAPSKPTPPVTQGFISFSGDVTDFPNNVGDVTISGMTSIGQYAFYSSNVGEIWAKATSLTIPNSVTSIGQYSFYGWTNATSVTIPNSVTGIGINAFRGWINATSLVIPNSVTSIASYAFYDWTNATTLVIPDSVTSIGDNAFYNWTKATSLTIPNSVTSISDNAFYNWTNAISLVIPESVTGIGNNAFRAWTSCDVITVLRETPPTITTNTFQSLKSTCIFKVPAASVSAYQAATNWSSFAARIQAI